MVMIICRLKRSYIRGVHISHSQIRSLSIRRLSTFGAAVAPGCALGNCLLRLLLQCLLLQQLLLFNALALVHGVLGEGLLATYVSNCLLVALLTDSCRLILTLLLVSD